MTAEPTLADRTADLLLRTGARLTRMTSDVLGAQEIALTYRQYRILTRVGEAGTSSLVELAGFASLTMPTLSESVSVLVRRGLVSRGSNPDDRRHALIELTPVGSAALAAASVALRSHALTIIRDFGDEDLAHLRSSLETVFNRVTADIATDADPRTDTD